MGLVLLRDPKKSLVSIRAIAFDFDGVLAESVDIKTRAYSLLFKGEGDQSIRQIVDFHLKNGGISRFEKIRKIYNDILNRPLSETHYHELCVQFSNLVVEEVVLAPWVNGAEEFLIKNEKKYTFAVVSGTPEDELKKIVQRREMEHFFDSVRGSPKNKVTLLGELMDTYQLKPKEMVFIGDAETDWHAAREVGLPFIWRHSPKTVSIEGYTGLRLTSLGELEETLRKIPFQTFS